MSDGSASRDAPRSAGRYTLHAEIASGGMATVYYGQMLGAHGFSRVVAVKRMLPRLARDPRFHAMFVDEARLASRVQHPNVVAILDVVDEHGEVMIVMEYVRGPSLSALLDAALKNDLVLPVPVVANIGCAMLAGLHAAHEARDRSGRLLGIVHRDVSPQNVLVGIDGVTRIMDFGVAKATELGATDDGTLTGKLPYMAPEQFDGSGVDRRTDVFASGVVLWSALAGRRLFRGATVAEARAAVVSGQAPPLSRFRDDVPPELEAIIVRALAPDRRARPETAEAFAAAIEGAVPLASARTVSEWVSKLAGATVTDRDAVIVQIEKTRTTMSRALDGANDEPEEVRSDVLTADWDRAASSGGSHDEPTLDDVPPPPATTRRGGKRIAIWALGAIASIGVIVTALAQEPDDRPTEPRRATAPPPPLTTLDAMIRETPVDAAPPPSTAPSASTKTVPKKPQKKQPKPPPKSSGPYLPSNLD